MSVAVIQEVARKLGGQTVLRSVVRSQADLALAVRNRLPLAALAGLAQAGLNEKANRWLRDALTELDGETPRDRDDPRQDRPWRRGLTLLWRLSGAQHAKDGGRGLHFDGRWKTVGHAVTYGSTSPSLCVLEKLVHIEDCGYIRDFRASASTRSGWRNSPVIGVGQEAWTQQKGDDWHGLGANPLLRISRLESFV
jgi:RES domain